MVANQFVISPQVGGAGQVALELSARLARGAGARLWIPGRGDLSARSEARSIRWLPFSMMRLRGHAVPHALECARIARHLVQPGSLVHVHNDVAYRLLRPAIRLSGAASVAHVQIEPPAGVWSYAFRYPPDAIVVCAAFLRTLVLDALDAMGQTTEVVSIPNAVDIDRFTPKDPEPIRRALGVPAERPFILCVGNLAPHKGQLTALRAMVELRRRRLSATLWLVGEEREGRFDYTERLRAFIEDAGLRDSVRLAGFRSDVPELLSAADVLVLPSEQEGLPLCVLEAQACKTLVVASPIAGVPEVVDDGVTGFLVPPGDAVGYAAAIERALAAPHLRQAIIEQAYARVQASGWGRYVLAMRDVYDYVLDRKQRHAWKRRSEA